MKNDKEVILLYDDNTIKRMMENQMKKDDLLLAKYILTRNSDRNFVMTPVTPLLYFDKCIIEYQLYYNEDPYDIELVSTEIDSITDLLSLVNSIDRLNCINEILHEETVGHTLEVGVQFFKVTLFKKGKMIYNKSYEYNLTATGRFYSFRITRGFHKIYSTECINDLSTNDNYLFLYKDKTWEIGNYMCKEGLIGIPLALSNTITFCTSMEAIKLSRYNQINCDFTIIDTTNVPQTVVSKLEEIVKEEEYEDLAELDSYFGYMLESFISVLLRKEMRYLHVEILSHLNFILFIRRIIFPDIDADLRFSSISLIILELYNEKGSKEIGFTENTLLPISDILKVL